MILWKCLQAETTEIFFLSISQEGNVSATIREREILVINGGWDH